MDWNDYVWMVAIVVLFLYGIWPNKNIRNDDM